jgi:hypothetical protein
MCFESQTTDAKHILLKRLFTCNDFARWCNLLYNEMKTARIKDAGAAKIPLHFTYFLHTTLMLESGVPTVHPKIMSHVFQNK